MPGPSYCLSLLDFPFQISWSELCPLRAKTMLQEPHLPHTERTPNIITHFLNFVKIINESYLKCNLWVPTLFIKLYISKPWGKKMFVLKRNYFQILINRSTAHLSFTLTGVAFMNSVWVRNSVYHTLSCVPIHLKTNLMRFASICIVTIWITVRVIYS